MAMSSRLAAAVVGLHDGRSIRGTGFFVTTDGLIATCYHVVRLCGRNLGVRATGGEMFQAKVIDVSEEADLATLRISRADCPALPLSRHWAPLSRVRSYGFSIAFSRQDFPDGAPMAGAEIVDEVPVRFNKGIATCLFVSNAHVDEGLSGGPLVTVETGLVVGILRWRAHPLLPDELRNEQQHLLRYLDGHALATPAAALLELCPDLVETEPEDHLAVSTAKNRVPWQAPPGPTIFVDREDQLARLDNYLGRADESIPVTLVLPGSPGTGKTALALHWANLVKDHFPGGSLFANMRGYDEYPPVSPFTVRDDFVRALGAPLPARPSERARHYQDLLKSRRIIVILDNPASEDQVRPLLPDSGSCLVLITSRRDLDGLLVEGKAKLLPLLKPLSPDKAEELLREIIGDARANADPGNLAELARRCAYLPVALRPAGARVSKSPDNRLADLVEELREDRPLDVLDTRDLRTAPRSVFSWSYKALEPSSARMFRLLGSHAGPDVSIAEAATLADTTVAGARPLLRGLADDHLLEMTATTRFSFHDLLRSYARECSEAEDSAIDRAAAIERGLSWFLHAADAADSVFRPNRRPATLALPTPPGGVVSFRCHSEALEWCESERANVVAATHQAAECGLHAVAWQLPVLLWSFFTLRSYWDDWIDTHTVALNSARLLADPCAQARVLNTLGHARREQGQLGAAFASYQEALQLSPACDRSMEADTLNNLADAYQATGNSTTAIDHYKQALAIGHQIADSPWYEGVTLTNLGEAYHQIGDFRSAMEWFGAALKVRHEISDRRGEARAMDGLGRSLQGLAEFGAAVGRHLEAVRAFREVGDRRGEAMGLYHLGLAYRELGEGLKSHSLLRTCGRHSPRNRRPTRSSRRPD
jgi:tetratricopeptide (TPR) repeat protein